MKKLLILAALPLILMACNNDAPKSNNVGSGKQLAEILHNYWEERLELFPTDATANGDNRYNDRLTITIAESFRDSLGRF